jgi:ABC-type branched-subunit amino acid transport system substrate-binding protein
VHRFRWIAVLAAAALTATALAGTATAQSSGSGGTKEALTATDVGVTATEIRIGVIADTGSSLAPGLFQGSVDAVTAWAKWMNANGGLAGRKIVVDTYDSGLDPNKSRNAIIEACSKDFALVGTSAIFVFNADDLIGCKDAKGAATGLPDFPVLTTEVAHQCSPVSFPINPPILQCDTVGQNPQTYKGSLNATPYLLKKYGKDALHGLYVYPGDLKASKNAWIPQYEAYQDAGIKEDASFDVSSRAPQSAYTPFVQSIKENGSTYATQGGTANVMISLMKEAKLQGVTSVKAWVCALQCYDKTILDAPETEGLYVSLLFLPFEEAKSNKMLATFLKQVGPDKADGFAAQAWAASVLFAESVEAAVAQGGENALTRANLLTGVKGIKDFNAEGMIGTITPSERTPSQCVIVEQVKSGKFVRLWPKKKGTFDCSDKNSFEVKMNLE